MPDLFSTNRSGTFLHYSYPIDACTLAQPPAENSRYTFADSFQSNIKESSAEKCDVRFKCYNYMGLSDLALSSEFDDIDAT